MTHRSEVLHQGFFFAHLCLLVLFDAPVLVIFGGSQAYDARVGMLRPRLSVYIQARLGFLENDTFSFEVVQVPGGDVECPGSLVAARGSKQGRVDRTQIRVGIALRLLFFNGGVDALKGLGRYFGGPSGIWAECAKSLR
jgi:hypothetical protein